MSSTRPLQVEVFGPIAFPLGSYMLAAVPNRILVTDMRVKDGPVKSYDVPNYGTDIYEILRRGNVRIVGLQYQEDEDGLADEVFVFIDTEDADGFGYALNITDHHCSEWGVYGYLLNGEAA